MRRNPLWLIAALALALVACTTDEGDAGAGETQMNEQSPTASIGDGGTEGVTLDDILNEPELYLDGNVAVSAEVAQAIEGANAWILVAGDQDVLLVGPQDSDVEASEGDIVVVEGQFQEYNPAQIGAIPGVVDEAAIEQAFDGEYVLVADSLEPAE